MTITVYTDGACSNNGMKGARAGIGVYFGPDDRRNISERISGKQTNNTAELSAIIRVAQVLQQEISHGEPVEIYSDSKYAIRCCTTYGTKLYSRGWQRGKRGNGSKPIPNIELVKQAYLLYKDLSNVHFNYVPAHTGSQDVNSLGNEGADRLANLAIGHEACMYHTRSDRVYLAVPYADKDTAKALGARWDFGKKKWYTKVDNPYIQELQHRWSRK